MFKASRFLVLLLIVASTWPAVAARSPDGEPPPDTAADLRDLWLRFHELELCQGLDATFVFHPTGIEIWCIVEEEKSLDKLNDMLSPLRPKYQIAVYPTRPQLEKKSPEDRTPPPSLWNNEELRTSLSDPFASAGFADTNSRLHPFSAKTAEALKQRMMMYAEQTLDWDKRLRRYAADLPDLTRMSTDQSLSPETRARAAGASLAHAQAVERLASRLNDNLTQAFPRSGKRPKGPPAIDKSGSPKPSTVESAQELSEWATATARRIYRFINPQRHTVGLVDLREPSLLEELRILRRMTAGFLRTLSPTP